MKVKQGAENMLTMLLASDKSKKLIADAEQMLADSKIKIDGIKWLFFVKSKMKIIKIKTII